MLFTSRYVLIMLVIKVICPGDLITCSSASCTAIIKPLRFYLIVIRYPYFAKNCLCTNRAKIQCVLLNKIETA